jgi:hypothetical protein
MSDFLNEVKGVSEQKEKQDKVALQYFKERILQSSRDGFTKRCFMEDDFGWAYHIAGAEYEGSKTRSLVLRSLKNEGFDVSIWLREYDCDVVYDVSWDEATKKKLAE